MYTLIGSISDENVLELIDDDRVSTYFHQTNAAICYVGYDFGDQI